MIGQEKLLTKFKSYNLQTLPHTVLLVGEEGCGKHTFISEVADYFELDIVDIATDIDSEQLTEYQQSVIPKIYTINIDNFIEKQQNKLLKFIEEPTANNYIFLMATSEIGILPTILNRCLIFKFEEYTKAQLQQFSENIDDLAFVVCKTPGQLLKLDQKQLQALYQTCAGLIKNINLCSAAKLTGYSCKINCKEDYKKFDSVNFFRMLLYVAQQDYLDTNNSISYKIYTFTAKYLQRLLYKNIVVDNLLTNYFINLKEVINSGN